MRYNFWSRVASAGRRGAIKTNKGRLPNTIAARPNFEQLGCQVGKVRESGMPEEEYWGSFFDPVRILATLGCPRAGDIIEFGCGYGHLTVPAAKLTTGTV